MKKWNQSLLVLWLRFESKAMFAPAWLETSLGLSIVFWEAQSSTFFRPTCTRIWLKPYEITPWLKRFHFSPSTSVIQCFASFVVTWLIELGFSLLGKRENCLMVISLTIFTSLLGDFIGEPISNQIREWHFGTPSYNHETIRTKITSRNFSILFDPLFGCDCSTLNIHKISSITELTYTRYRSINTMFFPIRPFCSQIETK